MNPDKIALVVDTNILMKNIKEQERLTDFSIELYDETINMIERNDLVEKINLFVPEIVWLELQKHKRDKLKLRLNNLQKISKELEDIEDIQIQIGKNFDYSSHIDNISKAKLQEVNIIKIPDSREDLFNKILDMAIKKECTFEKGESDKGFKDAIILLSLVNFAKESDHTKFVLFSKDKIFEKNKDQIISFFKKEVSKELEIRSDKDIQGYISEKFNLFIDFKQFLETDFFDKIGDEIRAKQNIVIEEESIVCKIIDFKINPETTFIEQIGEDEFRLNIGFTLVYEDKRGNKTEIDDLTKSYNFVRKEDEWILNNEEDFNYKVF